MLLSKGAKVYIATMDVEDAHETISRFKDDTRKGSIFLLNLNLKNLDSIKRGVGAFLRKESELHTLYNHE
jgi:hypothetical protein